MLKYILLLALIVSSIKSFGQEKKNEKVFTITVRKNMEAKESNDKDEVESEKSTSFDTIMETEIFTIVEEMPLFPGGDDAFMQFLGNNIRYPESAKESGKKGTAYISFMVDALGNINSPFVIQSSGSAELDNEALRVIRQMPQWVPGRQRGRNVNVQCNVPVRFVLR